MSITKIAKAGMEVTANYQKLSDLNVAFYNQDINTSILQFNVTRNDAVVPLGKTNVEGYIVLLHEDGSRIQDGLVIKNEEHGVIQYTIPREFLKHTGKVLGQVYIAVKGRDDTAVMRKISFDIKQDLMTAFSSIKKLEYIKTFDDLQTQIKQRVEAIEEAIANGEDYVAKMIATLDTGKKDIAATVSKANKDVNKVATDAKGSVVATADTATKNITSTATKATEDVNKVSADTTKKITDTSNAAVATVNAKGDEVLKNLTGGDLVQKKDYYPLIGGGGTRERLADGTDLLTLKTGYYEVGQCKNSPFSDTEASWKNIDVIDGNAGRKMLRLTVSAKGDTYYKTLHTNSTGGRDWWKFADATATGVEVASLKGTDTGWITYNTLNGVLANASFTDPSENGYKCAYRKITANGVTRLLLRVNISNITAESVIFANLPNGIVINSQSGVARTNKADQKVVVVLRPNGELSINVPTGFSEKSYTYNQFDWTF